MMRLSDGAVLLDVESRSRADLRAVGGRRYWDHPSSRVLVTVWYDTVTSTVGAWSPAEPWPHQDRVLVAHNAHGFDRFAMERHHVRASAWIDTAQLARKSGLPGALDALAPGSKDKDESTFTRALSSVRKPLGVSPAEWRGLSKTDKRELGIMPTITPADMCRVTSYCASDVAIMVDAWEWLRDWLDVDADVEALDRVINDRGVRFDRALARTLLEHEHRLCDEAVATCARELGWSEQRTREAARSPAQFASETGSADARAITVASIDHPLARAREALASVREGKLVAGLTRVSDDDRLRDALLYYGAHTGRWSGRGMQLQNLPRPASRYEDEGVDIDVYADEVLSRARTCDADDVAFLLRGTICAAPGTRLVTADFASIEARATAWAAGDVSAMQVFRSGRDPYRVAASAIYGAAYDAVTKSQRQVGKVAELALGYGGGEGAFASMSRGYRVDISSLDVPGIIKAWRRLHAPIVRLWHACDAAFRSAAAGVPMYAGPLLYSTHGDHVVCVLPSGRPIVYRDPHVAERDISYQSTRGRVHVYGGKLVENAVQALCRDLMSDALLRAESMGLPVVLHVHDEIVCEVPTDAAADAYDTLVEIMRSPSEWARDLPCSAKGWVGERYRK